MVIISIRNRFQLSPIFKIHSKWHLFCCACVCVVSFAKVPGGHYQLGKMFRLIKLHLIEFN